MKAEEVSKAQLIDQLRELKSLCQSVINIVETRHSIKSNRINSLLKKRYEITSAYRKTISRLDTEIKVTRSSQDYRHSFRPRSSDVKGSDPEVL